MISILHKWKNVLFFSEPVIALQKMCTETFTQIKVQQKKTGMNNTSKSTGINWALPGWLHFSVFIFCIFSVISVPLITTTGDLSHTLLVSPLWYHSAIVHAHSDHCGNAELWSFLFFLSICVRMVDTDVMGSVIWLYINYINLILSLV